MNPNQGHCFITEYYHSDRRLNNPIRGCIAFKVIDNDKLGIQFCKVYKNTSKQNSDTFSRKTGRELTYAKLDKEPIQYHRDDVLKVADLGIHASYLNELQLDLNMFTKSKLARISLELLQNDGYLSKMTYMCAPI